jgi:hypothetical protein
MEEREREIRAQIRLPESYRALLDNHFQAVEPEPRVYRLYRKNWGLVDPNLMIDYMVANILQFELLDEMIGKLFEYLKANDLYDNTWIYLIADHGEMNGEQALIDKGAYLNPAVIQVPLFLKPPASHRYGHQHRIMDTPVSLLDLAPTILENVGISTHERLDGISLFDTLESGTRPQDKPILFEIWSHVIPNPSIGMVFQASDGANYLFTFNAVDDMDELYRIENTKTLRNLYHDDAYAGLVQEALLNMQAILNRDPRWVSYAGFFSLTYAERLGLPGGDRQKFL